jgi:lipoprotein|nr:hypothetical protein [uncultured Capnocytophaga sp.]
MKKIMFFVLGILFLSGCGNSSNNSNNSVAVAPENRESFTENIILKNSSIEKDEKRVGYVKANEFNTLKEAILSLSTSYNFQQEVLNGDNEKYIKEAEAETKSKFYVYNSRTLSSYLIYYTPINNSKGKIGEITIYNKKIKIDWNNDEPLVPYDIY